MQPATHNSRKIYHIFSLNIAEGQNRQKRGWVGIGIFLGRDIAVFLFVCENANRRRWV